MRADGSHISRDPTVVVELLLDLLPLQTCYSARKRALPAAISSAVPAMLRFVQYMRLGDGGLGHFNGTGPTPAAAIATLAAYAPSDLAPLQSVDATDYVRLTRGEAVLLVDAGAPPPPQFAGKACAGSLSFELSIGRHPVFVNGGIPGPADSSWLAMARATASHNTLVLGAASSSRLLDHEGFDRLAGGQPIRLPDVVTFGVEGDNDALSVTCEHDGYRERFGLLHQRQLRLAKSGLWLQGNDSIVSAHQQIRLPRDIPFSIHFHLHPDVRCDPEQSPDELEVVLPDQSVWVFKADGATVSIEDSVHYADRIGPSKSRQIVLRGTCFGDKSVSWQMGARD